MPATLAFDRGTLTLDAPLATDPAPRGFLWDPRSHCWRAPALRYAPLAHLTNTPNIDDRIAAGFGPPTGPWSSPALRPYQEDALAALRAFEGRGVVVLPTGSGKTRVAIAALAARRTSALVLCPTRALLWGWKRELAAWYGGPIGVVGDGESSVLGVTLMTFESAYRHLDRLGGRFASVVVDEVHHFAGGLRAEALEMCPAPFRLGLTATPPPRGTAGYERLVELVGPVVCEVAMEELAGKHLAELDVVRLHVRLDVEERAAYERLVRPFASLRAAFVRGNPSASFVDLLRAVAQTEEGREAIAAHRRASSIASYPREKARLTAALIARHADDRTLVFTATATDAYAVSTENLIPAITADIDRAEREDVLARFREGRVRAIVSPRVLNEGIDVPDARVAIVVAGALGAREHRQRVGRVLRPQPGKRAVVYELVAEGTMDDGRARARALAPTRHDPQLEASS